MIKVKIMTESLYRLCNISKAIDEVHASCKGKFSVQSMANSHVVYVRMDHNGPHCFKYNRTHVKGYLVV